MSEIRVYHAASGGLDRTLHADQSCHRIHHNATVHESPITAFPDAVEQLCPVCFGGSGGRAADPPDVSLMTKQVRVLTALYDHGYYDWPRSETANDVADVLGMSAASLHEHKRKGLSKLVGAFVDEVE